MYSIRAATHHPPSPPNCCCRSPAPSIAHPLPRRSARGGCRHGATKSRSPSANTPSVSGLVKEGVACAGGHRRNPVPCCPTPTMMEEAQRLRDNRRPGPHGSPARRRTSWLTTLPRARSWTAANSASACRRWAMKSFHDGRRAGWRRSSRRTSPNGCRSCCGRGRKWIERTRGLIPLARKRRARHPPAPTNFSRASPAHVRTPPVPVPTRYALAAAGLAGAGNPAAARRIPARTARRRRSVSRLAEPELRPGQPERRVVPASRRPAHHGRRDRHVRAGGLSAGGPADTPRRHHGRSAGAPGRTRHVPGTCGPTRGSDWNSLVYRLGPAARSLPGTTTRESPTTRTPRTSR